MALTDAGVTLDRNQLIISLVVPDIDFTLYEQDTVNLSQYAVGFEGGTPSYSLTNTIPNGLSLNSSSGVLTYDGSDNPTVSNHQLLVEGVTASAISNVFTLSVTDPYDTLIEYTAMSPSADSVHPDAVAGDLIEIKTTASDGVEASDANNGSLRADVSSWKVAVRYQNSGVWSNWNVIEYS